MINSCETLKYAHSIVNASISLPKSWKWSASMTSESPAMSITRPWLASIRVRKTARAASSAASQPSTASSKRLAMRDGRGASSWAAQFLTLHPLLLDELQVTDARFNKSQLIYSLVLERFPTLKLVSVESGVGWIPSFLEALDYQREDPRVIERYGKGDPKPRGDAAPMMMEQFLVARRLV